MTGRSRVFTRVLRRPPEGIILEDLGSKNGTYCNGRRVDEPLLFKDGDLVQVALIQHFAFLSSDATMPLEAWICCPRTRRNTRLHLDPRSRRVWVNHKEVIPPLSAQQFRLLQHAGPATTGR